MVPGHGGATLHHRSQLTALPEHKLGVVVMANSAGATRTVNDIAKATLKLALQAKAGITQPEPPKAVPIESNAANLDQYVG
jgi:CubicO group peptidase (beta-lactamase class C family)